MLDSKAELDDDAASNDEGGDSVQYLPSALCLGLGSLSSELLVLQPRTVESWQPVLEGSFQDEPDSGTHSAAGFALRKWELPLPALTGRNQPTPGVGWWQLEDGVLGLTMLRIPGGTRVVSHDDFGRELDPPTRESVGEFWLSDREVAIGLFQQFMDDNDYHRQHPEQMPVKWEGPFMPPGVPGDALRQHPVSNVNWYDAAMFCNWLSWKLGRTQFYQLVRRTATKEEAGFRSIASASLYDVTLDPTADGFRPPTSKQWRYACRALTVSGFCFGDDERMLPKYGVSVESSFGRNSQWGSRLCNGWGLFDMHGNVAEWIEDVGGSTGLGRQNRGGSWYSYAGLCRPSSGGMSHALIRDGFLGIRLAAVPSSPARQEPVGGAESDSR